MVKILLGTVIGLQLLQLGISISNHFKLKKIMTKQDQINATVQELDDASNAIAAKINAVIAAEADNVSQASLDALKSAADGLTALGADPANPVPAPAVIGG